MANNINNVDTNDEDFSDLDNALLPTYNDFKDNNIPLNEYGEIDFDKLLVLRDVTKMVKAKYADKVEGGKKAYAEYHRLWYYIKSKQVRWWDTPKGVAMLKEDIIKLEQLQVRGRKISAVKIDLSVPSKLNYLYRPLYTINEHNRNYINTKKLKRYVNQDFEACINLKDFIQPQLTIIAHKLQCRQTVVEKYAYELIKQIYFDNDGYSKK